MSELTSLPNIGKELAKKIESIGVHSTKEFINTGAEQIFARIAATDNGACINMLYALEGAIQGIRWHEISKERKQELRSFYKHL